MTWLGDETVRHLREVVDDPDLSGTKYRLVGRVGSGGMATVFEVEDTELDRHVALKILGSADVESSRAERLLNEARVLAALEHPNLVPIHDVGVLADGRVFYVMKLVRGERLDGWAVRGRPLAETLRLFSRVCEAVAFAHAHGVIHRDLKPENVLVGAFGEALVVDWGLARTATPAESDAAAASSAAPRLLTPKSTRDGEVLGTPAYMAPEQARGETGRVDARSDVYALGGVLFFLLTGRPPDHGSGRHRDGCSPRSIAASVPRRLDAVCTKALAVDPADRYPDGGELAADVGRFLDGAAVAAYHEGLLERAWRFVGRHRLVLALVAAYVVMRLLVLFGARI